MSENGGEKIKQGEGPSRDAERILTDIRAAWKDRASREARGKEHYGIWLAKKMTETNNLSPADRRWIRDNLPIDENMPQPPAYSGGAGKKEEGESPQEPEPVNTPDQNESSEDANAMQRIQDAVGTFGRLTSSGTSANEAYETASRGLNKDELKVFDGILEDARMVTGGSDSVEEDEEAEENEGEHVSNEDGEKRKTSAGRWVLVGTDGKRYMEEKERRGSGRDAVEVITWRPLEQYREIHNSFKNAPQSELNGWWHWDEEKDDFVPGRAPSHLNQVAETGDRPEEVEVNILDRAFMQTVDGIYTKVRRGRGFENIVAGRNYGAKHNGKAVNIVFNDDLTGYVVKEKEESKPVEESPAHEKKVEPQEAGLNAWGKEFEKKVEDGFSALRKELAALKGGRDTTKAPEKQVDPDTGPLAQWEFAESPRFSERGERRNAALRARNEVIGSEARKLNGAKYFYEVAERWKKFPWWGKLGITLGIAGTGLAASVFAPPLAGFAALSAIAWRGAYALGSAAAMGVASYTYLRKRNSRYAGLLASIASIGMGAAVGVGGHYLGEYLNSMTASGALEIPQGTPDIHWSAGAETLVGTGAFPGGDLDSAIGQYVLQPDGPLRDFNLSANAEAELQVGLKMAILNDNPELAKAFLGRVPETVFEGTSGIMDTTLKSGDVINWSALGNPALASTLEDYLGQYSANNGGHLLQELENKGGINGLLARLQEVFAKK